MFIFLKNMSEQAKTITYPMAHTFFKYYNNISYKYGFFDRARQVFSYGDALHSQGVSKNSLYF